MYFTLFLYQSNFTLFFDIREECAYHFSQKYLLLHCTIQ